MGAGGSDTPRAQWDPFPFPTVPSLLTHLWRAGGVGGLPVSPSLATGRTAPWDCPVIRASGAFFLTLFVRPMGQREAELQTDLPQLLPSFLTGSFLGFASSSVQWSCATWLTRIPLRIKPGEHSGMQVSLFPPSLSHTGLSTRKCQ